jgi:hypothetical protein
MPANMQGMPTDSLGFGKILCVRTLCRIKLEKYNVAGIAEIEPGSSVAPQGIIMGLGHRDSVVKNIEVAIDRSPVDTDSIAYFCVRSCEADCW